MGTVYLEQIVNRFALLSAGMLYSLLCRPLEAATSFTVHSRYVHGMFKNAYVTGYQLQYSMNKNFKSGNKTVNISKSATVKKLISGLKSKKTYYIRIRTYKKASSTVTLYSAWSAALKASLK